MSNSDRITRIIFGMSGSIACYKACGLISALKKRGFDIRVVMTKNALQFVGPATIEGLTHHSPITDLFESETALEHIRLPEWADLTIICPASANVINKMSAGIADDALTSLFLAHVIGKPFLIAPAMNDRMYRHPITQESLRKLSTIGVRVLPTAVGMQACGTEGSGRLLEPEELERHVLQALEEAEKQ